jgi:endonuclease/exonuclease/phosphatase family metal-dependent hydrolase
MPSRASAVVALLAAGTTALAGTVAAPSPAQAARNGSTAADVTMVHANIKSALSPTEFQADVATVLEGTPDFVTYNEVPERVDWVMAPEGYEIHRGMRNRYTKATAVVWRADKWTAVDSGTFRISNYRKKPPGRRIRLGLRFANWVTLQSADGRQLSVVSVHVAPKDRNMPDLLRPSVRRVSRLVGTLAPRGPVLVGGDFNVHYKSGRYPRDLLDPAGLVPTYDTIGTYFATGDHGGYTIDYVFNRGSDVLAGAEHYPMELHSDHDAIVAGLDWLVDAPSQTVRLVSDPRGDAEARRRALRSLVGTISNTQPGQRIDVVTSALAMRPVFRRLKGAVDRGVRVRLITRSKKLTKRERRLSRVVAASDIRADEVRRCRGACLRAWRDSGMSRSFVLVRDADGRPFVRMDVNRVFNASLVQRRTRLTSYTGSVELAEGEELLGRVG